MSTINNTEIYSLGSAVEVLKEKIQSVPESHAFARIEIEIEPVDLLAWISQQKSWTKIFWEGRDDQFRVAAIGYADMIKDDNKTPREIVERISRVLKDAPESMRYYGGFAFDPENIHSIWKKFGRNYFILPQFEIISSSNKTILACNIHTNSNISQILKELNEIIINYGPLYTRIPEPDCRLDMPDKKEWQQTLQKNIDAFDEGEGAYEKVVLARKTSFIFHPTLNPYAIISRLKNLTSNCFLFGIQINDELAFIGASPERLYKRVGNNIQTEAIAGTRPRGATPEEDKKLQDELKNSPKDAKEHQLVVDMIQNTLEPLCTNLNIEQGTEVLPSRRGHHLVTGFQGQLSGGTDDGALIQALHPTPAVAGCPTELALKTIREDESFSRGWYCGPVGYIGKDCAEFVVAIRSGLVHNNVLHLFSGAGIVKGSDPDEEWEEIENKIGCYLKLFES